MRAPGSLRSRITLAALAAVLLSGLLTGALLVGAVERDARDALDDDLRERSDQVVRAPGPAGGHMVPRHDFPPPGRPGGDELLAGSGSFVQVAIGDETLERRGDVPADPPEVPQGEGISTVEIAGESWRSLTFRSGPDGQLRTQVLATLEPVQERVASIRRLVVLLGLAALALTALAAWAFTSVAVRPLERLRGAAERISGADDLSTRLPDADGPDEVRSLADTLNAMLGRLERAVRATRRFAGDAGHELRTPLTAVRANLDALAANPGLPAAEREAILREAIDEQERATHLLAGLQALARGEAAETLPREDVDLGDLVDAAVFAARRRHPGVTFAFAEHGAGATLRGWPNGLRLITDNLLDNAALHGGGGTVDVTLARAGDGAVVLRVDDGGPGIPGSDRERLLEPFARGEGTAAPGTGLGLAIVAQQAALHGASLELGGAARGGLGAEVRFPAPPA